jgi:cytochrome c
MRTSLSLAVWFGALALASLWTEGLVHGAEKKEAMDGRAVFQKRCTGCHALDHEKVGPRLAGVLGRKAGSVPTFPYSDSLKKASFVWNEHLLDQWLTDPESLVPDNDMGFRLNSPDEREAIITFLKETGK